jgi:hypothetical protein
MKIDFAELGHGPTIARQVWVANMEKAISVAKVAKANFCTQESIGLLCTKIVLSVLQKCSLTPPANVSPTNDSSPFNPLSVIGHGLMLLLSIAKWHNLLDSRLLVNDGDRQAPLDLSNLLPKGTDSDPDTWLMRHKSILAFPRRNASASSNRRSFGSKRYF